MRRNVSWRGLGFLLLFSSIYTATVLPQEQVLIYRRTRILGISRQVQSDLVTVLSNRKDGEPALQYGQTLGDRRLRTQVAKILASLGIMSDPEKNVGVFHDAAELYTILGLVFIDPGDVVMYQDSADDLEALEYYGAELQPLSFKDSFAGVKIVFINDSSKLNADMRLALLEAADEHNFIIVEKNPNPQDCSSCLKRDDKNGRVILFNSFDQIIPGISSIIPLVFVEASSGLMGKIESAKGNVTLCTNQILQGILIQALAAKTSGIDVALAEDTTDGSVNLKDLFSKTGNEILLSETRALLRQAAIEGMNYLAGGIPAPSLLPVDEFRKIAENLTPQDWAEILNASNINDRLGLPSLREAFARWMNNRYGTSVTKDNVLVTNGSQEVLFTMGLWAKEEGRKIFCEYPAYLGMLGTVIPLIGRDNVIQGDLKTKAGQEALRIGLQKSMDNGEPAPAIYVTPSFGNPSGALWTEEERQGLIDVVREFRNKGYDVVIFEDDPYGCLNYTGLEEGEEKVDPPLLSKMDSEAVVYLATMSKITSPGDRVGYFVGDQKYLDQFAAIMDRLNLKVATLPQLMTAKFVTNDLDRYIDEVLRPAYKIKCDAMGAALEKYMPAGVSWVKAQGGLFYWVTTPSEWGLDLKRLVDEVAVTGQINGIKFAYAPGKPFSTDGSTNNCARLCFSTASLESIDMAVKALGDMFRRYMPK